MPFPITPGRDFGFARSLGEDGGFPSKPATRDGTLCQSWFNKERRGLACSAASSHCGRSLILCVGASIRPPPAFALMLLGRIFPPASRLHPSRRMPFVLRSPPPSLSPSLFPLGMHLALRLISVAFGLALRLIPRRVPSPCALGPHRPAPLGHALLAPSQPMPDVSRETLRSS